MSDIARAAIIHRPTISHSESDTSTLCQACGLPWPCGPGQERIDRQRSEIERLSLAAESADCSNDPERDNGSSRVVQP